MRGRCTQAGVVLAEEVVLRGDGMVGRVARGRGLLRRSRLERILVAEAEVGPVAGLVLKSLRILDRSLQAAEVAHEVALAAGRLLGADSDEFLDHHGAVAELAGLLVVS